MKPPTGGGPYLITSTKAFIHQRQNLFGSVYILSGKSSPTRTAEVKGGGRVQSVDQQMGKHKWRDDIRKSMFLPLLLQTCCSPPFFSRCMQDIDSLSLISAKPIKGLSEIIRRFSRSTQGVSDARRLSFYWKIFYWLFYRTGFDSADANGEKWHHLVKHYQEIYWINFQENSGLDFSDFLFSTTAVLLKRVCWNECRYITVIWIPERFCALTAVVF